ncbi:hypothetical protein KO527_16335 [Pseudoalteromonas sp. C2R02]|uniref:DUF6289 family protein n=1 Tax=Pseudoalteromonas sp. C2R02 TaxID=2841565 RepID=UPI001C0877A4|nr:DUF6289 family protein [Pseudoalteromonas sp. C2R02]MBU2970921.1 hypothetical protein [Pseudoalteromonas sp. C2R02]
MTSKIRKTIVLASSALALLGTSYAIAYSNARIVEYVYYSDASKTKIVGESVQNCDGRVYTTGTITPYKQLTGAEPCRGFGW